MSITPSTPAVSKIRRKQILSMVGEGRRVDGRSLLEYRNLEIEVGSIEKAEGSAFVKLGKTKVLVGVKIEEGTPYEDTPNEGVLMVNAELVPLASPVFEPGPPDENAIELARVVDRGIRESKAIDLGKLCIEPGKRVFIVFVDIYVLDHDGNLIDASGIASLAALANAKVPQVPDFEYTWEDAPKLPLREYPIPTTFAKLGDAIIADPCLEEEQVMSARLTVTTTSKGDVCAMQKGGVGTFSVEDVLSIVSLARERGEETREKVLEAVGVG